MNNLEQFTQAYIEAMYFTDSDTFSGLDLSDDARLDIEADCRSFYRRYGCYIETDICQQAFDDSVSQAGHDFWMSRNGHGVGFWEDEWPECYRVMLDKGARSYGEMDAYVGDDNLIYV